MNYISSSSDSDIIDDTGCEDKFQSTYWDINYLHMIENDDELEMEDEEKEQEEEEPHARAINRIQYSRVENSLEKTITSRTKKKNMLIPKVMKKSMFLHIMMVFLYNSDDSSDDPVSIELDPKLCLKMSRIMLLLYV